MRLEDRCLARVAAWREPSHLLEWVSASESCRDHARLGHFGDQRDDMWGDMECQAMRKEGDV